jgi:hypothetical protein
LGVLKREFAKTSTGLLVAVVARMVVPLRAPVTAVVCGYAGLRIGIVVALSLLGRSTPDLPLAVLGFALIDLPCRGQRSDTP